MLLRVFRLLATRASRVPRLVLASAALLALGWSGSAVTAVRADPAQGGVSVAELDRRVSEDPGDPEHRLRLAQALLAQGQSVRAQFHLERARASGRLTPAERAALDRILHRMDDGKSREGWVRLALVPQSNPGQQTSATTVEWGGWTLTLDPGARAAPATGLHLAFGGALMPRLAPGLRLRLGAAVDARLFERTALNDVTLRTEAGFQGSRGPGNTWGLWLTAQQRRVANAVHARGLGLVGTWAQPVGPRTQVHLRIDLDRWRHPATPASDGVRAGVSVSLLHALRPDLALRASVLAQVANARVPWESGQTVGVGIGVQKVFSGGLVVGLDLSHIRQGRDGAAPGFAVLRKDRRTTLALRLMHRAVSLRGFAPVMELGLDRQSSSLPLHAFRNARVSLGLTREF